MMSGTVLWILEVMGGFRMREYENENTLHNAIALAVSGDRNSLVVVMEGDDDSFLLKRWVGDSIRVMSGSGGKGQVIRVAQQFERRGQDRVKFVVDRDYDDFASCAVEYPSNVLSSCHHDCFVDVLAAHERLLPMVVDYHLDSVRRSGGSKGELVTGLSVEAVVTRCFDLASMLAACRIVDYRYSLGLNFKGFKYNSIDDLNTSYIMQRLIESNPSFELEPASFCAEAEAVLCDVRMRSFPPVGDHDLFAALNFVVSKYSSAPSEKTLRVAVLSSLSVAILRRISWCKALEAWSLSYEVAFFVEA